jgi:NAD(P)-dependent dehydrogenase (short-subunit alcohol dehydrogenase family)
MGVRNVEAGKTAKAAIEADTKTSGVAEVWELDLASYASVKAFAKRAVKELERIDAVIENAGVAMTARVMAEG